MIKAVLFDAIDTLFCAYPNKIEMYHRIIKDSLNFDTTITDMQRAWDEAIAETEEKARQEIKHRQNIGAWNGFNARILEKLGYQGDLKEGGKILHYESWCNPDNFILYDDVISALESLKSAGIKIGCVSNEETELRKFFDKFNLKDYFEIIVISEEIACEKPNPEIFYHAIDSLKIKPEEALFVGDSLISDYEGSKDCGMNPVLIDREDKCVDDSIVSVKDLNEIVSVIERIDCAATTS